MEVFCWEVSTLIMALFDVAYVRFYELLGNLPQKGMNDDGYKSFLGEK